MKRNTWQREAVREALDATGAFVSAQHLHSGLREAGSAIGLATVYRALAELTADGDADSLQSADGENLYRACTPGQHHHHLICRNCGTTVEVKADAVGAGRRRWRRRTVSARRATSWTCTGCAPRAARTTDPATSCARRRAAEPGWKENLSSRQIVGRPGPLNTETL